MAEALPSPTSTGVKQVIRYLIPVPLRDSTAAGKGMDMDRRDRRDAETLRGLHRGAPARSARRNKHRAFLHHAQEFFEIAGRRAVHASARRKGIAARQSTVSPAAGVKRERSQYRLATGLPRRASALELGERLFMEESTRGEDPLASRNSGAARPQPRDRPPPKPESAKRRKAASSGCSRWIRHLYRESAPPPRARSLVQIRRKRPNAVPGRGGKCGRPPQPTRSERRNGLVLDRSRRRRQPLSGSGSH